MNLAAYPCTNCGKKSSTTCKSCGAPVKKVQRSERGVLGFVGAVRGRSLWVLLLGLCCGPQASRNHAKGQGLSDSVPGAAEQEPGGVEGDYVHDYPGNWMRTERTCS